MKSLSPARHALQERLVALRIVAPEGLAVLEHRLGRLLRIIKAVVLRAQMVLDDPDAAAQTDKHLSIFRLLHPERCRQMTRRITRLARRSVDGRQPLREEGDRLFLPCGTQVFFKLRANQADSGSLQGRIEEDEQIVPATVSRNEF